MVDLFKGSTLMVPLFSLFFCFYILAEGFTFTVFF